MDFDEMYPKFRDKPLFLTKRAAEELDELDLDLDDAIKILEEGFDCSRSKRAQNILEKCIKKANKIIKVVVAEVEEYWKIIHAGKFTISKRIKTWK